MIEAVDFLKLRRARDQCGGGHFVILLLVVVGWDACCDDRP